MTKDEIAARRTAERSAAEKARAERQNEEARARGLALAEVRDAAGTAQLAWFSLLGYLAFYVIVILTTSDLDFLAGNKQTQLPVVNISIASGMFYFSAPIVAVFLYSYLHFYCIILWRCARKTSPDVLMDALSSSLIGTIVVTLKPEARIRGLEQSHRVLGTAWAVAAGMLIWLAQPLVLIFALVASDAAVPAAGIAVSLITKLAAVASGTVGTLSFFLACKVSERPRKNPAFDVPAKAASYPWLLRGEVPNLIGVGLLGAFAIVTLFSIRDQIRPSKVELDYAQLALTPPNWTSPSARRETVRRDWCKGEALPLDVCALRPQNAEERKMLDDRRVAYCKTSLPLSPAACEANFRDKDKAFAVEWKRVRQAEIESVPQIALDHDLRDMSATHARLVNVRMEGATLSNADLTSANAEGVDLVGANLAKITGQSASFDRANLTLAELPGAMLPSASFEGADLPGAKLDGAVLVNAGLEYANLSRTTKPAKEDDPHLPQWLTFWRAEAKPAPVETGKDEKIAASLRYADLTNARLRGANLDGADLTGAVLNGADLTDTTGLTQDQLSVAIGNEGTRLPAVQFGEDPLKISNCLIESETPPEIADAPAVAGKDTYVAPKRVCDNAKGPEVVATGAVEAPPATDRPAEVKPATGPNLDARLVALQASLDALLQVALNRADAPPPILKVETGGCACPAGGVTETFTRIRAGAPLVIVQFDHGEADLTPEGQRLIVEAAAVAQAAPGSKLKVIGYADRTGEIARNLILSQKRADAVAAMLVGRGIGTARILTVPAGEAGPIPTADGMSEPLNRSAAVFLVAAPVAEASANSGPFRISSGP